MLNVRERRHRAEREELAYLVDQYGFNRTADTLNIHRTTLKRWLDRSQAGLQVLWWSWCRPFT